MESPKIETRLKRVSLVDLKREFSTQFPKSQLAQVLLSEPDTVSVFDFLAKTQTWLAILENERRNQE
jgi:hypothetical protein